MSVLLKKVSTLSLICFFFQLLFLTDFQSLIDYYKSIVENLELFKVNSNLKRLMVARREETEDDTEDDVQDIQAEIKPPPIQPQNCWYR